MSDDYHDPLDDVTPEDEALVVLDGTGRPFEWQPTISAAQYVNHALESTAPTRLGMIEAYIIGYNQGASDEALRDR